MSASPSQSPYADASPSTLLQAIEALAADAPEEGFALSEIMTRLDERAFGTFLFILALPVAAPLLYGVPQIVGIPMLALSFQMAMGRSTPWLPKKMAQRMMSKAMLTRMAGWGRKWFGWLERITKPRFTFMASKTAERIIGAFFCVFCVSILMPLPFTNTVPGIGLAIAAFGLMARDGIVVLLGLLIGSVWVSLLVLAPFIGLSFITEKMFPKAEGGGA